MSFGDALAVLGFLGLTIFVVMLSFGGAIALIALLWEKMDL